MKQQIQELIDELQKEVDDTSLDDNRHIQGWSQCAKFTIKRLQSILSSSQPEEGVKAWAVKNKQNGQLNLNSIEETKEYCEKCNWELRIGEEIVPVLVTEIKDVEV